MGSCSGHERQHADGGKQARRLAEGPESVGDDRYYNGGHTTEDAFDGGSGPYRWQPHAASNTRTTAGEMKPRRASSIPRQPFAQTNEKGDFGGVLTGYQVRRADEIQELIGSSHRRSRTIFCPSERGERQGSETRAPSLSKWSPELNVLDKLAQNGRPHRPESPGLFRFAPLGSL
jgi:hypothetical protein